MDKYIRKTARLRIPQVRFEAIVTMARSLMASLSAKDLSRCFLETDGSLPLCKATNIEEVWKALGICPALTLAEISPGFNPPTTKAATRP